MEPSEEATFFGDWIRQRRKSLDQTQEQLAQRVGCAAVTLKKIESGERRPSRQMALRLAQCLGISPEDQTLFVQIARGERPLERLLSPGILVELPARLRTSGPTTNLPALRQPIFGREDGLAELHGRIRSGSRLLTLTGPGGVGKTCLAIQAGWELLPEFPDGVYFVDLAAAANPQLLPVLIAQVLGMKPQGDLDLYVQIKKHLYPKKLLLILDNFEHLMPARLVVSQLLTSAPDVSMLVTSRAVLQLSEEELFVVPPLALPDSNLPVGELGLIPALQLLLHRAQATSGYRPDENALPVLAQICRRLEGLPLAIELAAVWLKVLSPQSLLERLDRPLEMLTRGARDLPDRQQTLRHTLDWSFELLTPVERRLFCWLGVFAGGFSAEALEGVVQDLLKGERPLIDLLASLVDHSLVQSEIQTGSARFRMLETLRAYAQERLGTDEELQPARCRHLTYFLQLAEKAEPELLSPKAAYWARQLESEQGNFWAALEWSLGDLLLEKPGVPEVESGAKLAAALWNFWYMRGYLSQGRHWLGKALAKNDLQEMTRARLLTGLGTLAWQQGDYASAQRAFDESMELWLRLKDASGLAEAWHLSGHLYFDLQDYENARRRFSESLEFNQTIGDHTAIATLTGDLGLVHYHNRDFITARQLIEDSLQLFLELDIKDGIADNYLRLGDLARIRGDFEQAESLYLQGLDIFKQLGSMLGIASGYHKLGYVSLKHDQVDTAEQRFQESLRLQKTAGNQQGIAECLGGLASVAVARGQDQHARELFSQAQALLDQIGAPLAPADRLEWEQDLNKIDD